MNAAKIIIPVVAGAAILGGTFISVPPENRKVEWLILGTLTGIGAIIAILLLRHDGFRPPAITQDNPAGWATIIPFRRAA